MCRAQEVKAEINWSERLVQLDKLVDEYQGRFRYDCLIPFSGGKDSTWTLYYLMNRYPGSALSGSPTMGFYANLKNNCDRVFHSLVLMFMIYS